MDGTMRSSGDCRLSRWPMNDFLDTEMQIGFLRAASFPSCDTACMSRKYQGMSVILVKKGFLPSGLKNPIEGSIMIALSLIPAFLALVTLSLSTFVAPDIWPVVSDRLYAQTIVLAPDCAIKSAIVSSYISPVTSLITSAPAAMAALAVSARGVSAEMGKLHALFAALIALAIRRISSSTEIIVSRYGAVDMAPMSIKCAPSCSICRAAVATCSSPVLTEPLKKDSGLTLMTPITLAEDFSPMMSSPIFVNDSRHGA